MPDQPGQPDASHPPAATLPQAPGRDAPAALAPALQQALMRLQHSRARLEQVWLPAAAPAQGGAAAAWRFGGVGGLLRHLRRRAAQVQGLAPIVGLLEHWWARQPWRLAGQAVVDELAPPVLQAVRRQPLAAAGLALGAGFALVWFKPWRQPWAADHLNRAPRYLGLWLLRQARTLPVDTLIASLLTGLAAPAAPVRKDVQPGVQA